MIRTVPLSFFVLPPVSPTPESVLARHEAMIGAENYPPESTRAYTPSLHPMSHSNDEANPPTSARPEEYQSRFQSVSDPASIIALLKRAQEAHTLLSVTLADDIRLYNSALLGIMPGDNTIELDELHRKEGHNQIAPGSTLHIMTRLHGVEIRFHVRTKSITLSDGIAIYRCTLPAQVQHLQRRAYYRARSARAQHIRVDLQLTAHDVVDGELVNLSVGGLAVRCKGLDGRTLAEGMQLTDCLVPLPGLHKPLMCTLVLRNLHDEKQRGYLHLGFAFIDLDIRQQQQIERAVATLDRQNRKRATRSTD